jgi:tetratricopeptide (TPR) repeat protein
LAFAEARTTRFVMFDAVAQFLKERSFEVPQFLAIDDLHRADLASAALFHHLAQETSSTGSGRLMLVATYRDGELRVKPAVRGAVADSAALGHAVSEQLDGLTLRELGTFVRLLSGYVPSESVVADLHSKTNGNPFFVAQILRVIEREGRLNELVSSSRLSLELPSHVQDAIRRQLRILPEPVRELLEFASVLGVDFGAMELEDAIGSDRSTVLELLGIAAEAGVLVSRAEEPERYRFLHVLMRDAIYAGIPRDIRAAHHARLAQAIEKRNPEHPSERSALLAHHYSNSTTRADLARSVHFFEMAASWASARGAFEDAPPYLDRALALLDDSSPATRNHRCRLLLRLGDALSDAGARERARQTLQAAASLALRAGLHEELAIAALRFAPDLLAVETGVFDRELVRILEDAIVRLGTDAPPLRARLLARLAVAHQWNDEDPDRSQLICQSAQELASEIEDVETREFVSTSASLINFSVAEPELQVREIRTNSESLEILQRVLRITSQMLLGRVTDADAEILSFAELMSCSRYPQARWYVDLMRATRAEMSGRYDEGDRFASRFLAEGQKYGDRNAVQSYGAQKLMRALDVGDLNTHECRVRSMVEAFPRTLPWHAALVLVLAEVGRLDEARSELHRTVAARTLERSRPNEWYGTATGLALSCGLLGEPAIAERWYEQLYPRAEQLVVIGYMSSCLGSVHRLLASLASAMRHWDRACTHFEAAFAKNLAIGARACNASVCFEYARTLKRMGRRPESALWAARAVSIGREFGMTRLVEKSRSLN